MARIHHRDDAIQPQPFHEFGGFEGLDNRARIGQASGFNQNVIESLLFSEKVFETAYEIAAHTAAEAPVVEFENFFVNTKDELVVDIDRAKFVDDDGTPIAMRL
jgi:hypothetical protein